MAREKSKTTAAHKLRVTTLVVLTICLFPLVFILMILSMYSTRADNLVNRIDDWVDKNKWTSKQEPQDLHTQISPPLSIWERVLLGRPPNYQQLSPNEQWKIDAKLGVLDWDGSCSHKTSIAHCDKCWNRFRDKFCT